MFNWGAAIGFFSFVGMFVCGFLSVSRFENRDENAGAAFLVVAMFLVFVSGGVIFA